LAQTHQQDMIIAQSHNKMWYKLYIIYVNKWTWIIIVIQIT
jgi:hypothetical protein